MCNCGTPVIQLPLTMHRFELKGLGARGQSNCVIVQAIWRNQTVMAVSLLMLFCSVIGQGPIPVPHEPAADCTYVTRCCRPS